MQRIICIWSLILLRNHIWNLHLQFKNKLKFLSLLSVFNIRKGPFGKTNKKTIPISTSFKEISVLKKNLGHIRKTNTIPNVYKQHLVSSHFLEEKKKGNGSWKSHNWNLWYSRILHKTLILYVVFFVFSIFQLAFDCMKDFKHLFTFWYIAKYTTISYLFYLVL